MSRHASPSPSKRSAVFKEALLILCVLVAAVVNFVIGRGEPALPFWDENYYITNAQRYVQGTSQISSHPPLGLMLIAAGEAWLQPNAGLDLSAAAAAKQVPGDQLPAGYAFNGLRFFPSLFAALGALLFYAWLRSLTGRAVTALAFTTLFLFENALLVHLPAAHLDAFFVMFAIAAMASLTMLITRAQGARLWWALSFGFFAGLTSTVKLPGLLLWAPAAWVLLTLKTGQARAQRPLLARLQWAAAMGLAFMLAVLAVFWIHASLIRQPPDTATPAGQQDLAAMSPIHRELAYGQRSAGLVETLVVARDQIRVILTEQAGVPEGGPQDSKPWLWPIHHRAQNYRWDSNGRTTQYVQFAGNLFNWAIGLAGLVVGLIGFVWRRASSGGRGSRTPQDLAMDTLIVAYVTYMAAHLWLGTQRIMYLYHYLLPLVMTFAMACLAWSRWELRSFVSPRWQAAALLVVALGSVSCGLFYYPLSRHMPLTVEACEQRNFALPMVKCIGQPQPKPRP